MVAILAALAVVLLLGAGWYYSDQIIKPTPRIPLETGLGVVALGDGCITLSGSELARAGRRWFLEWPGGYGVAGDLVSADRIHVTRRFQALVGAPRVGGAVDLGAYPFRSDPRHACDLTYQDIGIHTHLGAMPAWFVPGTRDTWVLMVHGLTANRGEALRAMPAIAALGYPILVISYRNDVGAPASKDRLYHLGQGEWEDLQAAVRYALKQGARRVVLFGFSMGGSTVADMLDRSEHSHDVAAVILDAPVLDWNAVVQLAAHQRRVPDVLTTVAEWLVSMRTGFAWNGHEGRVAASEFTMPVLLFHGTADATAPIGPSESLAAAAGERVTFVRTKGAGHVQSWNFDPDGYERALRAWLPRVAPDSLLRHSPSAIIAAWVSPAPSPSTARPCSRSGPPWSPSASATTATKR